MPLQTGYFLVSVLKLALQSHWHWLLLFLLLILPFFESEFFPTQLLRQGRTDLYQLLPQIFIFFSEFVKFWVELNLRLCLGCGYWYTLSNGRLWWVYYWLFCLKLLARLNLRQWLRKLSYIIQQYGRLFGSNWGFSELLLRELVWEERVLVEGITVTSVSARLAELRYPFWSLGVAHQ